MDRPDTSPLGVLYHEEETYNTPSVSRELRCTDARPHTADDDSEQDTDDEVPHGHSDHNADDSDIFGSGVLVVSMSISFMTGGERT